MKEQGPITQEHFIKRIGDLCLRSGLTGFPKDDVDQHILLKSAVITLGGPGPFTEKEINERLQLWHILTRMKEVDHVTMRRALIDSGYITRSSDGSTYQVVPGGSGKYTFDETIDQLDLDQVISNAKEEIERRKRAYMNKAKGS